MQKNIVMNPMYKFKLNSQKICEYDIGIYN